MQGPSSSVRVALARRLVLAFPFALVLAAPAAAQQPKVGDPAPPVTLASWLNVEAGKEPTLESLQGRVVMIEFWGTWCGPCVRAMPEVQKLHDRYRDRGLTVLAISRETPEQMKAFLATNGYTMPVGSDPEQTVVKAYGIRGWPSTFVIDKAGKIAHVGSPYDAEAAVEKALGLEASPATLLTAWLDSLGKDKATQRAAIERLCEKATPGFDLRAWARGNGGGEVAVADPAGGGAATEPVSMPAGAADAAARNAPVLDGDLLLGKLVPAWTGKDAKVKTDLLVKLGADGPTTFDLAAFARAAYGKAFPLDQKELKELLQQQRYADVLQALVDRSPPAAVAAAAAKDKGLQQHCRSKVDETRSLAKKAVMAQRYLFEGLPPQDNDGFFGELAVSGMAMSEDKKRITGVLLGGAMVAAAGVDGWVLARLQEANAMDALAAGKAPQQKSLRQQAEKERAAIVAALDAKYGVPRKPQPK